MTRISFAAAFCICGAWLGEILTRVGLSHRWVAVTGDMSFPGTMRGDRVVLGPAAQVKFADFSIGPKDAGDRR